MAYSCWATRAASVQLLEVGALLLGRLLQVIQLGRQRGRGLGGRGQGPLSRLRPAHHRGQGAPGNLHLAGRGHLLLGDLGQVHLGGQDVGVHHRAGLKAGLGDFQVGRGGMAGLLHHRQVLLGQLQPEIGLGHLEQQLLPGTQDVGGGHLPAQAGLLVAQMRLARLEQGLAHHQAGAKVAVGIGVVQVVEEEVLAGEDPLVQLAHEDLGGVVGKVVGLVEVDGGEEPGPGLGQIGFGGLHGQARGRQGRVVLQGQEHGLAQGQGSSGRQGRHAPTEAKP